MSSTIHLDHCRVLINNITQQLMSRDTQRHFPALLIVLYAMQLVMETGRVLNIHNFTTNARLINKELNK